MENIKSYFLDKMEEYYAADREFRNKKYQTYTKMDNLYLIFSSTFFLLPVWHLDNEVYSGLLLVTSISLFFYVIYLKRYISKIEGNNGDEFKKTKSFYVSHDEHNDFYENLHDGNGKIKVHRYFETEHPWSVEIERWELPKGASEGMHVHDATDADYGHLSELYIITEGNAEVTVITADRVTKVVTLNAGDSILIDPTIWHNLRNIGNKKLRLLIVYGQSKKF